QEQKFKAMSFTKSEFRRFNRIYFSGASDLTPDKQGRILIPTYLKEYAGIKKDVFIIGVSNRIEIWGRESWKEYYQISKDTFEEVAEKLIDL
ncbi:MAG: cell division/cell wall cluster transcriptional repressor MraZ, partial [Candidatus Omnitrophica bacterium]|nr:cell division/cell wall cluster transcriptional repressor MraZ [Candidatus Omnitrophota bacterium]